VRLRRRSHENIVTAKAEEIFINEERRAEDAFITVKKSAVQGLTFRACLL